MAQSTVVERYIDDSDNDTINDQPATTAQAETNDQNNQGVTNNQNIITDENERHPKL